MGVDTRSGRTATMRSGRSSKRMDHHGEAISFAALLRGHRHAAGLTQEQLAERAGLSVHGIQKLERGATHPYRDTAQRLIAALRLEGEDEARLRSAVAPVRRHGSEPRASAKADARHNLPSFL